MPGYDYDIDGRRELEIECDCGTGGFTVRVGEDRAVIGAPQFDCECRELTDTHWVTIRAAIAAADRIEANTDWSDAYNRRYADGGGASPSYLSALRDAGRGR
jgi:hypothetical protein